LVLIELRTWVFLDCLSCAQWLVLIELRTWVFLDYLSKLCRKSLYLLACQKSSVF